MDNKNDLIDTVIKTETKKKRQDYMREYKKKQYMTKGEDIQEKNKAYYYKKKLNMSDEDLKKYIKKGFLKIHLNSKYLQYIDLSSEELLQLKRKTAGLMYESSVYKKIINPIIDNKVCVNFIICL